MGLTRWRPYQMEAENEPRFRNRFLAPIGLNITRSCPIVNQQPQFEHQPQFQQQQQF